MTNLGVLLAWAYLNLPWLLGFVLFIGILTVIVDRDEERAERIADRVYRR